MESLTRKIPLGKNRFAIVDSEDFWYVAEYKWSYTKGYAFRRQKEEIIFLHNQIMKPSVGKVTDHINGNGLDNRRCNLRVCTQAQNCQNRRPGKNNKMGLKGVSWMKSIQKWRAYIWKGGAYPRGRQIHLGFFDNKIDAAKAYNQAAVDLFGEFANLNEVS